MDEVIFRSSQKLENFQVQSRIVFVNLKEGLVLYIQEGKVFFNRLWNSPQFLTFKINFKESVSKTSALINEFKEDVIQFVNPKQLYLALLNVFGKKWTTRDICFACGGVLVGGLIGVYVGMAIKKKKPILRYMQAIQCNNYMGPESITVVEDAFAPYKCSDNNVLVNVKAASLQLIDIQISHGYGRNLRSVLQKLYSTTSGEAPVILGRDCTGIITDIGAKVTKLEVGDEVWLTVPFWAQGTLCQSVLIDENRVARKPKNLGFEGASSLPYSGSLALSALIEAHLDSMNAEGQRILVHGGCTPVGCVLVQLLSQWKASITVTCYKRAVPVAEALGATDVIIIDDSDEENDRVLKELDLRDEAFDIIIITDNNHRLSNYHYRQFLREDGALISTLPPILESDSYGVINRFLIWFYINLKYRLQKLLGLPINTYDETHLCSVTLEKLSDLVEDGYLQTVVDKIYQPHNIELAINHIQSPQSIGSTIITFR